MKLVGGSTNVSRAAFLFCQLAGAGRAAPGAGDDYRWSRVIWSVSWIIKL